MKEHRSFWFAVIFVVMLANACVPAAQQNSGTPQSISSQAEPTITTIPPTIAPTPTALPPTPTQVPRVLLPVRGMYTQFDRRGWPSEYWSGEIINGFNKVDDVVGHTVSEEVSLQLDEMKRMGVNTIAFELRSADPKPDSGPFVPPACNLGPALGVQYPQPRDLELTNLVAFLDMVQSKGMKVYLRLVNTHMEPRPTANNELWLGSILNAVKDHPALDLVLFEGNARLVDTNGDKIKDACGIPAEPPLWEGPSNVGAVYVKWAIDYGHSLGVSWRKLSAEAIVGDYFTWMQTPNPFNTDGHFWDPVAVLKGIFDDLKVPDAERTYAISFYEHCKCTSAQGIPCEDENPHAWAIETANNLFDTIGRQNGARVIAVEMGVATPVEKSWTTEMALQSLVWIMQTYGIDGGCFWRWVDFSNSEELDPTVQMPVKKRGVDFTYYPVKGILEDLYTRGQANDLSLTPDQTPPAFSAVSSLPTEIKNGEPFVLSASLGETHLFVTVDISALDPAQTDPILFREVSDGVYQATVTLNPWNSIPDGMKTIRLQAMDFWSNTSSEALDVELKNPSPVLDAVPPEDDFTGTLLDQKKWKPDISGGASVIQNDRLILSTDGKQPYSSAGVRSSWEFPGDFDVQVDFQLGEGWASPAREHLDGAYLSANIAGQNYRITRLRSRDSDTLFSWSSTGVLVDSLPSDAKSGQLRLVRVGQTLTLLYDVGKGWQVLARATVPSDPAQIAIGNASVNASMAFTTSFEHFKINSGLTTYKP
jgi:hypothetical protein